MFLCYCVLAVSAPLIYQMLILSIKPRMDTAEVYCSLVGPVIMGLIMATSMWIVLAVIPFLIFGVDLGITWPLWKMFFWVSEVSMILFYFKPAVNWIRKINGLPAGLFYEYPHWWA